MKKVIFITLALCIAFGTAIAAVNQMIQANQITVEWDAANNAEAYRVWTRDMLTGGTETMVIECQGTEATIAFETDFAGYIGVQAVRYDEVEGNQVATVSAIIWSDVPEDCLNGQTFGRYFFGIGKASNLR